MRSKLLALCFSAMMVVGCATGPQMGSIPVEEWEILPGKAQIVVYDLPAFHISNPRIWISGEKTKRIAQGSVFVVDVAPGNHSIGIRNIPRRANIIVNADLFENERAYVDVTSPLGLQVRYVERYHLVDNKREYFRVGPFLPFSQGGDIDFKKVVADLKFLGRLDLTEVKPRIW